jgi:NADH-quinone oxidoreductase subunit M
MGPIATHEYSLLTDAKWNEKWAAGLLIIGIVIIGVAPFWLNDLIAPATETLMKNIGKIVMLK